MKYNSNSKRHLAATIQDANKLKTFNIIIAPADLVAHCSFSYCYQVREANRKNIKNHLQPVFYNAN